MTLDEVDTAKVMQKMGFSDSEIELLISEFEELYEMLKHTNVDRRILETVYYAGARKMKILLED